MRFSHQLGDKKSRFEIYGITFYTSAKGIAKKGYDGNQYKDCIDKECKSRIGNCNHRKPSPRLKKV